MKVAAPSMRQLSPKVCVANLNHNTCALSRTVKINSRKSKFREFIFIGEKNGKTIIVQ